MIYLIKTISRIKYKILIKNINWSRDSFWGEFNTNYKIFVDDIERCVRELFEKPNHFAKIIFSCQQSCSHLVGILK